MTQKKHIDFAERAKKLCGQKTKTLIPLFPLTPTALQSPEIVLSIDDPEAFFEAQAELETKIGRVRSDLLPKEKELILATVSSLNRYDLEGFLLTRCNVQDPSRLNWEGIFARLRWYQSRQAEKPAKPEPAPIKERLTLEQKAIAVLYKNPCLSDKEIAEAIGCSRTTLYDFRGFKKARAALRAGKREICKGTKYNNRLESYED